MTARGTFAEFVSEAFAQFGGIAAPRRILDSAESHGLITVDALLDRGRRYYIAQIERVLRAVQPNGLPFAGPSAPGSEGVWKQVDLWTYADFEFNLQDRVKQLRGDYDVVKAMQEFCRGKFGRAPVIPRLSP